MATLGYQTNFHGRKFFLLDASNYPLEISKIVFFLFFIFTPCVYANQPQDITRENTQWLIEEGLEDMNNREYPRCAKSHDFEL